MKISATIITLNEEKNIANAIKSLDFADEIVVVDSESTDKTREIAEKLGAKVFTQKWLGFGKQKQFASEKCLNDWIFSLDADEVVSEQLKEKLVSLKKEPEENLADAYKISRLAYYMNRPIKYCGWYPDWQLRFFNRKKGVWKEMLLHESVQMEKGAKIVKLKKDILHYGHSNASYNHEIIGKRYAPLAAEQLYKNGVRSSIIKVCFSGITKFIEQYIIKLGFLDGLPGFCICYFGSYTAFLKYLLLWEMQKSESKNK